MVYVISKHGKPLMPCSENKARHLLKIHKARIIRKDIFTIQLLYRSNCYKQLITLGVDTGSRNIGLSASTLNKELFSGTVLLRTNVVKLISNRKLNRQLRRNRKTRYRQARFNNRTANKKSKFMAPSIKQRMQSHLNIILKLSKLLPINKICVEVASFNIQKLQNSNILKKDCQQESQLGFWNVREYVLYRDNHKCQYCKGKSGDNVLQIHHIESRRTGGNSPGNLITLCSKCHKAYHNREIKLKISRVTSFKDASVMNGMCNNLVKCLQHYFTNIEKTYGYYTKYKRINIGLPKEHFNDAFYIANNLNAMLMKKHFIIKCISRHCRSLHVQIPTKGNKRRSLIAPYWINNSKFTKFDKVLFNGHICFISGSSDGYPVVKDIYWRRVDGCKTTTNFKKLRLITHKYGSFIID